MRCKREEQLRTGGRTPDEEVSRTALLHALRHALAVAGNMTWQVTWSLILGFFTGAKIWGPIIGPLVAVATFVCSIGNVPLVAALWNGGISFGGVISFIFADLIIIPLLLIYAKYYGRRMAWFMFGMFYLAMVLAGYVIELVFGPLGLVPSGARHASVGEDGITWNYTSVLNIAFLALAALLVWRFLATGGRAMLARMGSGPDGMTGHA